LLHSTPAYRDRSGVVWLDADIYQAFGLIVRRINDEPFDVPSVPGSRAVTIKFIIPNSRMGSVSVHLTIGLAFADCRSIGKGGSKIKEIQEASGARLNASEAMLPGSTEVRLSRLIVPFNHF
jgi:poly(rC)-binding protein 2/3/4